MSQIKFRELISNTLKQTTVQELSDMLLISQPTILRWANGKNLPRPSVEKSVRSFINKLQNEKETTTQNT
jgi:transcriptional regulator with XRE-family HTH domain